jgi:small conductance mechanosensitive channel
MESILQHPLVTAYIQPLVGFLAFVLVGWFVAGLVRRTIRRNLEKTDFDVTLTRFVSNLTYYIILIVALIAGLQKFGVSTASFAAVLGAAGLAIGLAFQGALSNFAAGVMLVVFRPFKVGDVIEAGGARGKVYAVQLFTTEIDTPDNRRITIPNSDVFSSKIENVTYHDTRRVDVAVGTDYPADLEATRQVLVEAAESIDGRLEDKDVVVYLDSLGDSAINWAVRVWSKTEDYWDVREALTHEVKARLDDAEIGIPYPQMDVHVDSLNGASDAPASESASKTAA